jgi:stage V sporulation protein R
MTTAQKSASLPPHLQDLRQEIEGYARGYGLDFFDTIFEVVGFDEMNMVAAYGGFPNRYPHWRWGMEYEQLSKSYEYGLSKIYELVINNNPSYAYLLESNADVDQKLVMAHVFGHVDFFKHNFSFAHTDRKMVDQMANHATRVRRIIDRVGIEPVEAFVDRCLSIENLIDQHRPHFRNPTKREKEEQKALDAQPVEVRGLKSGREYMSRFINPQTYLDAEKKRLVDEQKAKSARFPLQPERDVLLFLLEHAPLERWEADVLAIVREEATYFAPQGQTKIMNEGWASFWHSRIMTQKALRDSEIIDYADHHAGTMSVRPGSINPYKLGIELWRDIEDRWNRGRFGKDWEECDDWRARRAWDKKLGLGREKIFEVRKHYNDITFIDAFLTPEFAMEQKLFVYNFDEKGHSWKILTREFGAVKAKLLQQLTNFGQPLIEVVDANLDNRGELLLVHRHDGVDLDPGYARDTLANLQALWRRPVAIQTRAEGRTIVARHDGKEFSERRSEG